MRLLGVHAALVAVLFLLAGGSAAAFEGRAVDLSAEFERARAGFQGFLQSPDRFRDAARWNAFADRFRKILDRDPGGARADDALFMLAEVNLERHRIFRKREHLEAAIAAYTRLLQAYRFSSRTSDALVRLADIHYYNLDDSRRAYLLYRRAARAYPDTEAGRRAGVRVVALEARHPGFSAQGDAGLEGILPPPRSARPLPSPGAVIGGRRGSVVRGSEPPPDDAAARAAPAGLPARSPRDGGGPEARAAGTARARPPADEAASHPLLQEGAVPFKRPSDDLPTLRSIRR